MQGLILNEKSFALNLILRGSGVGKAGQAGMQGTGAHGFLGGREPKKCAHSVQMTEKVSTQGARSVLKGPEASYKYAQSVSMPA